MESCSCHTAGHLPGCRTGDSDALGTSVHFASCEHPHGLCWPHPSLLSHPGGSPSEHGELSYLWIRTTQMEIALEQQIPLEGEDHPRKPPREVGVLEIQGEPTPGSGMGREGPGLPNPTWARRTSVQPSCGEAQAGPSPSGKLWVPGTGVGSLSSSREPAVRDVWAASQRCISTRQLRPPGPRGFGSCSCDVGQPQSPLPPHGASQLWRGVGEGGLEPGWARERGVM